MTNEIHPTAIIHQGAELDGVSVGPFCVVGEKVRLGRGCKLISHVHIDGDTQLGTENVIHPFAAVGGPPQDLKYAGEPTKVIIGNRNHIRESVTIHRGTHTGETRIGDDCLFMAYSHVAHDCVIGNHVVLANCASLAGHVEVHDWAVLGGLSAVHQFCRVGTRAFLSGGTMIGQDAPPYCIAEGRRGGLAGVNVIGLQRAGYSPERVTTIKRVYKAYYVKGTPKAERLAGLDPTATPDTKIFLDFVRDSKRGVLFPIRDAE